jgi:SPASM domain peptide maturase of grasp-with-spasm system
MDSFREESGAAPTETFRLYASCKLVKGGAYSAIYDLSRRLVFRFDTAYFGLFALAAGERGLSRADFQELDPAMSGRALEAIEFLKEREVGRYMDSTSSAAVIPLSEEWDSPHSIINSIIDVDEVEPDWAAALGALDDLKCRGLQVRGFSSLLGLDSVTKVLETLQGTGISRVDFVVKWQPAWDNVDWPVFFQQYRNLQAIRIHSAPRDLEIDGTLAPPLVSRLVNFQTAPITGADHCGAITSGSLSIPSPALFGELKSFNGCLNRKVSIRADGEICNCPSMRATFGKDLGRLREVVTSKEFQRSWHLKKDALEVCRGCEFRYVCTDCRAYLESDVSLGKPAKCSYDPASGIWGAAAVRAG